MVKACSTGESTSAGSAGERDWREGLLVRRYRFPPSGEKEQDLATRIEHANVFYYFPLGSADPAVAAMKARSIHETVVKDGWPAANRHFSRELIIAFEWCLQPVLWTYTTIHTLVGGKEIPDNNSSLADAASQRVLIVERDAGVRRALAWSINQQAGFKSISCPSIESFQPMMAAHKPHLVMLNHNLAGLLGFENPGTITAIKSELPALTYSVYADGDQMFAATPGGAEGYLVKRVKPDCLLDPITHTASQRELPGRNLLGDVKLYFQKLLESPVPSDKSALNKLTRREREVMVLLSKGCVDKEIAQALGISVWTVHGHIKSIFERLQVHTRTEAVVRFLEK
jgi:DNA-binding NarL/FixJ family response regulator